MNKIRKEEELQVKEARAKDQESQGLAALKKDLNELITPTTFLTKLH